MCSLCWEINPYCPISFSALVDRLRSSIHSGDCRFLSTSLSAYVSHLSHLCTPLCPLLFRLPYFLSLSSLPLFLSFPSPPSLSSSLSLFSLPFVFTLVFPLTLNRVPQDASSLSPGWRSRRYCSWPQVSGWPMSYCLTPFVCATGLSLCGSLAVSACLWLSL